MTSRSQRRYLRTTAVAALATAAAVSSAHAGAALPTGGKVVAGAAVIGPSSAGSLSISQSSSKAIIDWGSFSIGKGGAVSFANGDGATLNRVTGQQVSSLDGLLSATGSVYLINPNGVIIGKSGVVNVGGTFVASTLDTSSASFLAGGALSFAGSSSAAVVSYGKIGALGGDVALIAARVANDGSITAANGDAGLLAGYKVVLKDASLDDGRFAVELDGSGTSATNAGLIAAADAELRAEGGNVYALAGDTAGVIRATGVESGGGKVWLVADGGTLHVAGTLQAQGAGGATGAIETSGHAVQLGSARIDAHGGTWLVDPTDLTIDSTAASTIDTALNAGTSVTEQTTASGSSGAGTSNASGNGDIIVAAPIAWTSTAGLSLSAYRNIDFNAPVTASGGGALTLVTDNSGAGNGGGLLFNGGAVQFTGLSGGHPAGSLAIGVGTGAPVAYTLVGNLATLSADIAANNTGAYALATVVDGSNGGFGYTSSPLVSTLVTPFAGALEGLGNGVTGLKINDATDVYVGLFSKIAATGVVRDLLISGVVEGGSPAGGEAADVGLLAGYSAGVVSGVTGAGQVGSVGGVYVGEAGGLVGDNDGALTGSSASAAVSDGLYDGGLVGVNDYQGVVTNSSSSGSVSAGPALSPSSPYHVGGLAGRNLGAINASYATGEVGGAVQTSFNSVGGLVGDNIAGAITGSYATGAVADGGAQGAVGGLAGLSSGGTITRSYATGTVQGDTGGDTGGLVGEVINNRGGVIQSYASGAVTGGGNGSAGGLIGYAYDFGPPTTGSITLDYATGAVSGGPGDYVGGLVGDNASTITSSYASGAVSAPYTATPPGIGGFAGENTGTVQGVWDRTSTGQMAGVGSSGASSTATLVSVQDTDPTAADYVYSTAPYAAAGLGFGVTPGGSAGAQWVIVDADGSLNNANGATGGTRPLLLAEYSATPANAHQLQLVELDPTASYTLAGDIDASGTQDGDVWGPGGFIPIGGNNSTSAFTGTFAGAGHAIDGLTINDTTNGSTGLFGEIGGAGVVRDIALTDVNVSGMVAANTGALAGVNLGTVTNAQVDGTVTAFDQNGAVGGLIGDSSGRVSDSSAAVTVFDGDADVSGGAGGLIGALGGGLLDSDVATGAVSAGIGTNVGGLVGSVLNATIENSYAMGAVTGGNVAVVGGLVGLLTSGQLQNVYATGAVTAGPGAYAGGLVGEQTSYTFAPSQITDAYATGAVNGSDGDFAGGLVGYNTGAVTYAYALGAVTIGDAAQTTGSAGGLIGYNAMAGDELTGGAIADAYATGAVSGGTGAALGGLVGTNFGTISAGYYDQGTTGQMVGVGNQTDAASGVGAVGGNTGLSPYDASSYPELQFGTTPGGASGQAFVVVDLDGSLNGAGGAAGGIRPLLLSEYTTNIVNVHQLQLMELDPAAAYTLAGDVAADSTGAALLGSQSFQPMNPDIWSTAGFIAVGGNAAAPFTGSLDGAGYTLSDLTINDSTNADVGLFGVVGRSGSVTDLTLVNNDVASAFPGAPNVTNSVGGVAGVNQGVLDGLSDYAGGAGSANGVRGSTSALVGGLAGTNSGQMIGDLSAANVSGGTAGGLVGLNTGTIAGSLVGVVGVSGQTYAGGLVGEDTGPSVSTSSSAAGVTSGFASSAGGLIGAVMDNTGPVFVSYVSASGQVDGDLYTGGLVGYVLSTGLGVDIDNAYATGKVTGARLQLMGPTYVGGLVGYSAASGGGFASINDSYATGAVSAGYLAGLTLGGLVGELSGAAASVNDVYALGSVTLLQPQAGATSYGGGLVGNNAGGAISGAYATGAVASNGGVAALGGVVGANSGSVNHAYWDVQTTGQLLDPAISLTGDPAAGSIGLTTAQFMDPTSPISGLGLGTAPSETGGQFVIVDVDGTFNGAGGAAGATRPFLVSEAPGFQPTTSLGSTPFYTVQNLHQLQLVGLAPQLTYEAVAPLGNDIDASASAATNLSDMWGAAGFVPIGTPASPFSGTFYGSIDNLVVNKVGSYAGLFGVVGPYGFVEAILQTPTISGGGYVGGVVGDNFGSVVGEITGGSVSGPSGTGGVVGVNEAGSVLEGVTFTDPATGEGLMVSGMGDDVGGVVGANFGQIPIAESSSIVNGTGDHVGGVIGYNAGSVQSAFGLGNVTGRDYVGGVVGLNYGQVTTGSSSEGQTVTGRDYVGGLIGWNTHGGLLQGGEAFSGAVVASGDYAGGLVGVNQGVVEPGATAQSLSVSSDAVSGSGYVGGLVGLNQGSVSGSIAGGAVSGNLYLGGLVGWNDTGATITTSYAAGTVTGAAGGQDALGNDYVGGLVGVNFGAIANTYATGAVSGVQVVGGLVGANMPGGASVTTSYATGAVTASQFIAGSTFGVQAGEVSYVYGFPALSGQGVESGYYNTPSASGDGTDLTLQQEDGSAAYVGFDFTNIWQADPDGPPTLMLPAN